MGDVARLVVLESQLGALDAVVGDEFTATRWWRAIDQEGLILETSNPTEAKAALHGHPGARLERLYERVTREVEWREQAVDHEEGCMCEACRLRRMEDAVDGHRRGI